MDSTAPTTPETISAALRMVLRGLMAALGGFGLEAGQAVLVHRRIGLVLGRIERMLARFRAGRLWRVMGRPGRSGAFRCAERTLPQRFGWLVRAGGHRAAGFGSQLQTVLNTPEMTELLAASPQAGRLLRPLCRALAVEMPGAAPCVPATERPKAIRRRRTAPKPPPFRIPLPRGVLTAARREGFGKLC
jgi:hypothetical protein